MIQASLRMKFTPQKIGQALEILHSIVERIRAEKGCISCSIFQDTGNELEVVFLEKWKSDEDLQRHLRSEDYKRVLLVMEMAMEQPDIKFYTITGFSGVETIKKARMNEEGRSPKDNI